MITMKTGAKGPVRFVFSDKVSETTVTLQSDDDSATVVAKLQRVLELEGGAAAARLLALGAPPAPGEFTREPLFDAAGAEAAVTAQPIGWEALAADGGEDLPVMD